MTSRHYKSTHAALGQLSKEIIMTTITITIHTDNSISVGSTITGYQVAQTATGTVVKRSHNNGYQLPRDLGATVNMPANRYTLSSDAGRAQFDADFLAAWAAAE